MQSGPFAVPIGAPGGPGATGYPRCVVMSRMTDQIGRVLSGRYRLIAPIGTGASAQVYLADDVRLRRRVAVKVLHAALAEDDAFLRRFRAEAQAAAALNHPQHRRGLRLGRRRRRARTSSPSTSAAAACAAVLDRGVRLTPSQALMVGLEATRALDYAHRRGFVHRDIKPANLLFGDDGRLRIADFGLARALAEAAWTEPQGAVLGTARYASPEQAQGQPVDGKADVYSLGLVLIECVTGTVPFAADTTIATLMARVGKPVEVPEALGPLRKRARAGRPARRRPTGPTPASWASRSMATRRGAAAPRAAPAGRRRCRVDATDDGDGADATMLGAALGRHAARRSGRADRRSSTRPTRAAAPRPPRRRSGSPTTSSSTPTTTSARRRRWPWAILVALLAVLVGGGAAFAYSELSTPSHEIPDLERP